ncbi:MAG: hypothetical protein IKB28_02415 [Clostridia bacterium]|nr:hypothetical protein [Clostridia bacterium]
MRKNIKESEMTSTQLFILSMQTCQWWNAVFVQAKRFFEVLEINHGGTPWDESEDNGMFVAERMFLITALHHAIENLQKLNIELQRKNDNTFQPVLDAIELVAPLEDIKNLRDMNEHGLDYLVDKGRKQDDYRKTVEKGDYRIHTTAAWTHVHADANLILLGNVEIDKLLLVMKEQLPIVKAKTKEIFENSLYAR